MLDRFKVPPADQVRVSEAALRGTVADIFEQMHLTPEDAALGAGHPGHDKYPGGGEPRRIQHVAVLCAELSQRDAINPRPQWRIVRESPSTATIDGDGGLGIILGPKAMQIAIDKARTAGVGIVTMFNGRHLGAAGYHAMLAAQADMVGMCMTATQPSVVPTFGAGARSGTNRSRMADAGEHAATVPV